MFRTWIGAAAAAWVMVAMTLPWPSLLKLSAPLRYLGTISYGIYLWHLSIIMSLHGVGWLSGRQALPYVLVATAGAASLSWHFFERPLLKVAQPRRGGSRFGSAPKPTPVAAGAQAEAAANLIREGAAAAV